MTHTVNKQMGISHADFYRLLPHALDSEAYTVQDDVVTFDGDDGRSVHILLGPEWERRIALLHIPVTDVTITFDGYDAAGIEAFLLHFDHSYQRGGG